MGLVVTVTANAALDRTVYLDELRVGRRQRIQSEHAQAGGKGVNVSRVLASLGVAVRSVIVVGGDVGRTIQSDLSASGLAPIAIQAYGESRTCLEILETQNERLTQIHGAGVRATTETARALIATVEESLEGASWVALSGSLPEGCPEDTYARLTQCAQRRGVRVALDTSGAPLKLGWAAAPDILRVNREEMTSALGAPRDARLRIPPTDAPGEARLSVVSDGPRDAWAWIPGGPAWRVAPPAIRERNALGCGDAMLAGLLIGLDAGPVDEALRFATSLAAASATQDYAGHADKSLAEALAPTVRVDRI